MVDPIRSVFRSCTLLCVDVLNGEYSPSPFWGGGRDELNHSEVTTVWRTATVKASSLGDLHQLRQQISYRQHQTRYQIVPRSRFSPRFMAIGILYSHGTELQPDGAKYAASTWHLHGFLLKHPYLHLPETVVLDNPDVLRSSMGHDQPDPSANPTSDDARRNNGADRVQGAGDIVIVVRHPNPRPLRIPLSQKWTPHSLDPSTGLRSGQIQKRRRSSDPKLS